jgi:mevalonate kinase
MSFETFVASAPGKIILFGEHAVVHGSRAVATVINKRIYAEFSFDEKVNQTEVLFEQASLNRFKRFSLASLQAVAQACPVTGNLHDENRLRQLHACVEKLDSDPGCQVFLLQFIGILEAKAGLTCRIVSDIPLGSGLGSSASFSVAMANGLFHLRFRKSQALTPVLDNQTKVLINTWAFQGEKVLHGDPSGVDNTCATFGGAIVFRRGHDTQFFPSLPEIPIILTNTNVPNRSTKNLVARVAELKKSYPAAIDPIFQAIDSIVSQFIQKIENNFGAEQVAQGSARGRGAREDFLKTTGDLMKVNHHLLNALGVGHATIDRVLTGGEKYGFVTKTTGAGNSKFTQPTRPNDHNISDNSRLHQNIICATTIIAHRVGGGGCVISLVPSTASTEPQDFSREMKSHG